MNKIHYLFFVSCLLFGTTAFATGIPAYGKGEVVNITVDRSKSADDHYVVRTVNALMDNNINITGGPETYCFKKAQTKLAEVLKAPSAAIQNTKDGLKGIYTSLAGYSPATVQVKSCGETTKDIVQEIEKRMTYPATVAERLQLTEKEVANKIKARAISIEQSGKEGLAKAWAIQSEVANVSESLSKLPDELKSVDSQMDAFVYISKILEESYKNMDTRLSVVADDLNNASLLALDGNI